MLKKYFVKLSEKELEYAQQIITSPKCSNNLIKRANVLLMHDEEADHPTTQEESDKRCAVSDVTVYHTVRDYCEHGSKYALTAKRCSKPPRAAIVDGESEAHIIALACSKAPAGFSHWTVRLLIKKIVELQIVESISRETVCRTLKTQLKPHLKKQWCIPAKQSGDLL